MTILLKYNSSQFITFPVIKAGSTDFAVSGDWTPIAADCKITKSGGDVADCAHAITAIGGTGSALWKIQLDAAELSASRVVLQIVATEVEDQAIMIETYGNASARHAFDLDLAEQTVDAVRISGSARAANQLEEFFDFFNGNNAVSSADGTIVMPVGASAVDDYYNGMIVYIVDNTGKGQARLITDYVGMSRLATITPDWTTQPNGDVLLFPGSTDAVEALVALSTQGKLDVNAEADTALADYDAATGAEIAAVQSDTDDIQTRIPASLVGGRIDANVGAISGDATAADQLEESFDGGGTGGVTFTGNYLWRGLTGSRTSSSVVLSAGGSTIDGAYIGSTLFIAGSTGAGQSRIITGYNGTTKVVTISPDFDTTPGGSSLIFILHSSSNVVSISGSVPAADLLEERYALFGANQATSSADSTIVMPSTASSTDDFYNGSNIFILTGNGRGQARLITDYVGSSRTATITPDWTVQPTSADVLIFPGEMDVAAWRGTQPNTMSSGLVNVDLERLRGTVPNILVDGRFDARVGAMASGVLTAAALATDAAQEIADEIFRMTTATIEAAGGGTPDDRTLYGVIAALMHKHERDGADNNIVLYESDDSTILVTIPITKGSTLDPIKKLDPP